MTLIETCDLFHILAVGKLTESASFLVCSLLYTFISSKRQKITARAEAFQPGHLTWRTLASRRHCLMIW